MKPRGIPIAQIDSNMEGDPKLVRLRIAAPAAYYTALGSYTSIVLRAWATASRMTDADLLDLIDPDIVALLVRFGLLDDDRNIPAAAFAKWPGAVLDARSADAARKRTVRRTPEDSGGLQRSPQESIESSSTLLYREKENVEKNEGVLEGEGAGRGNGADDDPVTTYYLLTTRYPRGNALDWCKRLGDTYGFAPSSAAMTAAWGEDTNIRTLLSRAEDRLVAAGRAAELAERKDERERLRKKREAVYLGPSQTVVPPAPERASEIIDGIRKAIGK